MQKVTLTFNVDRLVSCFKVLERTLPATYRPEDYTAFGCEIILNGANIGNDFSLSEILEEQFNYEDCSKHLINFRNHWDSFLFYSPSDIRGFIFDFGYLSEGKVMCYDGLHGMNSLTKVTEYTIDDFINEYGMHRLMSITHYRVYWPKLGVNWNN